ncbi:MAG: hypothetical protein ACR2HX_07145 [Pyrinomonadaceae bacterium]
MIISLVLVLLVTASGTLATYLYDEGAPFAARLCAGACIGIATLGLVGFLFASFLGLTPIAIVFTLAVHSLPLIALKDPNRRAFVKRDLTATYRSVRQALLQPRRIPFGYVAFYLTVAVVLWQAFQRGMIELPGGIYTGLLNNYGDLPFHLSVITSFAYGNNFPPEDPTYAFVFFTYPFLTDFVSAIFVRCGADLRQSMFIENFVVGLAFVGLLHRWALVMVRDRLAAVLTPLLVLLNGGLGWVLFWDRATADHDSLVGFLKSLPPSFTVIPETTWRWGNAISTLLIPQRGFLLGLPLAVIVFTQWWLSDEKPGEMGNGEAGVELPGERGKGKGKKNRTNPKAQSKQSPSNSISPLPVPLVPLSVRRMIAAGIVAGLLPLVHAHSFVVVMAVGGCIALLQRRWRVWIVFCVVASLIALPQMWWSTHNSAVDAKRFLEWQFGWDRGQENAVWFWLKNSGAFIPLTIVALLWRGKQPLVSRRLLLFFLPFTLCFIVPNVLKLAPWIWDNIKVLFYWWLASAPLVALLLARLWQQAKWKRIVALALFACVTAAGALDVAAILISPAKLQVFDSAGVAFAELIKQKTEPRALVIHAPVHNHPVFLTGRKSLMGYPGHIWSHGLDYVQRESEIKKVYAGTAEAESILRKYGVAYAVVSSLERKQMSVNDQFFSRFELVGEAGGYRLYKITQP